MYRVARVLPKDDGSQRKVYDAYSPLKRIQKRIVSRILRKVEYPRYLQGGIRDRDYPRDHVRDAELHAGQHTVITEDAQAFFPSITSEHVFIVWKRLFNFPDEVAACLTSLTTRKNELPQGAATSTYIANLIFFETEPDMFKKFRRKGMRYSRFVDDTNVSASRMLTDEEKSDAIESIIGMMASTGLKRKWSKHKIQARGGRVAIHNLNANSRRVTLPKERRAKVRAIVRRCELVARTAHSTEEHIQIYNSAAAHVGQLKRLHPTKARKLRERLDHVRPIRKKH